MTIQYQEKPGSRECVRRAGTRLREDGIGPCLSRSADSMKVRVSCSRKVGKSDLYLLAGSSMQKPGPKGHIVEETLD